MENVVELKNKIKKSLHNNDYVERGPSEEDRNAADKYASTGESEFSRASSHPLDEVLSERHFSVGEDSVNGFEATMTQTFKRSDDQIKAEILELLMRSTDINPSDVEVAVSNGLVTLTGSVQNAEMKKSIDETIHNVFGVKSITNELALDHHGKPLINNTTGLS